MSSLGSIINPVSTGIGAVSNFLLNRKKSQLLNNQLAYQKYVQSLAQNPAKMNAYVSSFEQPLSQGLVSGVGNAVQANLGEKGLSASPSIATDVMAQALAPYQQNEQQMAINEAFSALGLPSGAPLPQFDQPLNLSTMIQQLLKPPQGQVVPVDTSGGSVIPPISDYPNPTPPWTAPPGTSGGGSSITDIINSLIFGQQPPALAGAS